jgi:lipopolysaccharide/colanic/teichoic acid biosynthesis glycosyltransferase
MPKLRRFLPLIDFLAGVAGYGTALVLYVSLMPEPVDPEALLPSLIAPLLCFWLTLQLQTDLVTPHWTGLLAQICLITGLSLLAQALLIYFRLLADISQFSLFIGAVLACSLVTLLHRLIGTAEAPVGRGVLLLGGSPLTYRLASTLGQPVVGVLAAAGSAVPSDLSGLGDLDRLAETVSLKRPARIVVDVKDWSTSIPPAMLLDYRLSGIKVDHVSKLYEQVLQRVCCSRLKPTDLLLSPSMTVSRRMMAVQAVYTNVLALAFLLSLSPILIIVSLAIALFGGPGPVFDDIETVGFQGIPFRRIRFRTRRTKGSVGSMTAVGRLISRLHLADLPQLINVVRGEMALVGPRPIQVGFAKRLMELMPFYAYRSSVRPGIFGWAQLHSAGQAVPSEIMSLEYDLYYIKESSPALDIDILIRSFVGPRPVSSEPDACYL